MSQFRIHLNKLVCQAANQALCPFDRHLGSFSQWCKVRRTLPWNPVACVNSGALVAGIRLHCTATVEPNKPTFKKRKENPNAKKVIGNVGRLIPYTFIQVINENGEDLGKIHRRKAIEIMEEQNLKLVLLRENETPPLYKLMTGKQLFEKQIKLREQQKLSTGSSYVQIKEMAFLASIEKHDLEVKKKQFSQWIEKKHHVRITIKHCRSENRRSKEDVMNEFLKSFENQATCSSPPKEGREGRVLICVLRPLSAKELQKQEKMLGTKRSE